MRVRSTLRQPLPQFSGEGGLYDLRLVYTSKHRAMAW